MVGQFQTTVIVRSVVTRKSAKTGNDYTIANVITPDYSLGGEVFGRDWEKYPVGSQVDCLVDLSDIKNPKVNPICLTAKTK